MNGQADSFGELPTLSRLSMGERARVRVVDGGKYMTQRMAMLGIRPGTEVRVVHGPGQRGVVLQVGGARIALGSGILEHIRVETDSREGLS